MKSLFVYDRGGKMLFHFKRDKKGVVADVCADLTDAIFIKVILHDGSIIKLPSANEVRRHD